MSIVHFVHMTQARRMLAASDNKPQVVPPGNHHSSVKSYSPEKLQSQPIDHWEAGRPQLATATWKAPPANKRWQNLFKPPPGKNRWQLPAVGVNRVSMAQAATLAKDKAKAAQAMVTKARAQLDAAAQKFANPQASSEVVMIAALAHVDSAKRAEIKAREHSSYSKNRTQKSQLQKNSSRSAKKQAKKEQTPFFKVPQNGRRAAYARGQQDDSYIMVDAGEWSLSAGAV